MSRPFAITAASNSVFLDEDRKGKTSFTVSNQSGRSIGGRAQVVTEEAESWVSLRGEAHRTFAIAGTEQYTVEIEVPPEAPSGSYTLRLDMVGEERPDEQYVEGPTVTFEVPEPEEEPKPFPWKVVTAVAVVLLIGGGVLAWDLIDGEISVNASFIVDPEAPSVGDEVRLDATESMVTGASDLAYSWSLSAPEQSDATIDDPQAESTSFTADLHGDYEVGLEVSAGEVSDSDAMTVAVELPTEEIQTEETEEGLVVQVAAPGAVEQNEEFEVRVAITNERADAVTLTFSNGCLMGVEASGDEENEPFQGTAILCPQVITDRDLSGGETLENTFDVSARLEGGDEVHPGTYAIRGVPYVMAIDGEKATLPAVEQDLIVF